MRKIYIDMDDVVADWMGHVSDMLNDDLTKYAGTRLPNIHWEMIKTNQRLYRYLPVKEGAAQLISWLLQYQRTHDVEIGFLTAIPKGNDMIWAPYDKVLWARDNFPRIPVFFGPYSNDKHKHATPGDILIDDRPSNITEWNKVGGIGHLYTGWETCRPWLENTLGVKY